MDCVPPPARDDRAVRLMKMGAAMDNSQDSSGSGATQPTPRELRAARRRAHEEEQRKRTSSGGGGKGDKKKGGGNQGRSPDDRRRQ